MRNATAVTIEIERWTEVVGTTRRGAYNVMALHLAVGFREGRLAFWFCDAVSNAILGFVHEDFIALGEDSWPELFNEVYLAFDSGEIGTPEVGSVAVHTRPAIAEIVERLRDTAG